MTKAYVTRVLEAIFRIEAEVIRLEVEAADNGATVQPGAAVELLPAIYSRSQLTFALGDLADDWQDGNLVPDFRVDPAPPTVTVTGIEDAAAGCIVVRFDRDDSPTVNNVVRPVPLIAVLNPKPDSVDPDLVNESPWVIADQAVDSNGVEGSCTT